MDGSNFFKLKLISREVFKYFFLIVIFGFYLVIVFFVFLEKYVFRIIYDYVFKIKVIDLDILL